MSSTKVKKYPILEEAKKKAKKIRGAKGYTDYTKKEMRKQEIELALAKVEMRKHIFERIKKVYVHDLALLEEAERELNIISGNE